MLSGHVDSWRVLTDSGGLIEGIRYRDTISAPFVVGVQWHPERSEPGQVCSDGLGIALLDAVQAAAAE